MKFTFNDFIKVSYLPLFTLAIMLLVITFHNSIEQNKINAHFADQDLKTLDYLNQTLVLTKKNIDLLNLSLDKIDSLEKQLKQKKKTTTKQVFQYKDMEYRL